MNLSDLLPRQMLLVISLLIVNFGVLSSTAAMAHELRLGYLQISEHEADTYRILFKIPVRNDYLLADQLIEFPKHCQNLNQPTSQNLTNNRSHYWQIHCPGGLSGAKIGVKLFSAEIADILVRLEHQNGTHQIARLSAEVPEFMVTAAPNLTQIAVSYFTLGVEHILLGIDHLLFILALLYLVNDTRRLVLTITGFTVAHSMTLAAATLGVVAVPAQPVEAVIALSIVFVAREIIRLQQGYVSLTAQKPWLVAFIFGLLHGFGFAGALNAIGLPQVHIPAALLFFNLGVEMGQLLFVAAVVIIWRELIKRAWIAPNWIRLLPAYSIGSLAMGWFFERVAAF